MYIRHSKLLIEPHSVALHFSTDREESTEKERERGQEGQEQRKGERVEEVGGEVQDLDC